MISEILNALFITYVATEYHLQAATSTPYQQQHQTTTSSLLWRPHILLGGAITLIVNILDRVSGAIHVANDLLHEFLYAPKIVLVIAAYAVALHLDCKRIQPTLDT